MVDAYHMEDNYCQIELLPSENYFFCVCEMERKPHAASAPQKLGYAKPQGIALPPRRISDLHISEERFASCLALELSRCDRILSEDSNFERSCTGINAYGANADVTVFYETEDNCISAVWFTLDVRSKEDCRTVKSLIASFASLGDFILVDWGWNVVERINEAERISRYINKRQEVFSQASTS